MTDHNDHAPSFPNCFRELNGASMCKIWCGQRKCLSFNAAPPVPTAANVYWMIERGSPCEWWVGNHRISNERGGEWTTDSSKAQHFNEDGAKHHARELELWGIPGPLHATEHVDILVAAPSQEDLRQGEQVGAAPIYDESIIKAREHTNAVAQNTDSPSVSEVESSNDFRSVAAAPTPSLLQYEQQAFDYMLHHKMSISNEAATLVGTIRRLLAELAAVKAESWQRLEAHNSQQRVAIKMQERAEKAEAALESLSTCEICDRDLVTPREDGSLHNCICIACWNEQVGKKLNAEAVQDLAIEGSGRQMVRAETCLDELAAANALLARYERIQSEAGETLGEALDEFERRTKAEAALAAANAKLAEFEQEPSAENGQTQSERGSNLP